MKSNQEKLAKLFIQDVPKFGWSRETLLQCAKKQRISTSVLAKLFPSFEYDVLKLIIAQNNTQKLCTYTLSTYMWSCILPLKDRLGSESEPQTMNLEFIFNS